MSEKIQSLQLYTLEEVAALLEVTTRTLYTYIKDGKLKAQKIGGRWKISEENLKKFINVE
jgi:excisionase family DNA binding protein